VSEAVATERRDSNCKLTALSEAGRPFHSFPVFFYNVNEGVREGKGFLYERIGGQG